MTNKGNLISVGLLCFAAGATVGMLLASEKGSELREKILNGLKDLASNIDLDGWKEKLAVFMGDAEIDEDEENASSRSTRSAANPI